MKEKTKAEKLIVNAVNACGDNESLLVVYSGKDDGNVAFTGNPNELSVGFAYILANGVVEGATKEQRKLADSVLNGIFKVLSVGDTTSLSLLNAIDKVISKAKEVVVKREQEKSVPSEFDPHDENCLSCEDYVDCAIRFLRDMRKKMLRNVRNGGGNDGNVTKKNKKQHKHTNQNK